MSANIFSLTNLRKWLETKPPEEKYCYTSPSNCLAAQYCHAHGITYDEGLSMPAASSTSSFLEKLEYIGYMSDPRTFGAALALTITLEQESANV